MKSPLTRTPVGDPEGSHYLVHCRMAASRCVIPRPTGREGGRWRISIRGAFLMVAVRVGLLCFAVFASCYIPLWRGANANARNLTLRCNGVRLGDSRRHVEALWGRPKRLMRRGLVYDDPRSGLPFRILLTNGKVSYVEAATELDVGAEKLRIGDRSASVVRVLGSPDLVSPVLDCAWYDYFGRQVRVFMDTRQDSCLSFCLGTPIPPL